MIVTTAGRTSIKMTINAQKIASELNVPFVERRKKSIRSIQVEVKDDILVIGKERYELYSKLAEEPFFFHPNSSMFRIKRIMNNEYDPFVIATNLHRGNTFLDCTLGLASDCIVASFIVGDEGCVTGIEGNSLLSFIVKNGMKNWDTGIEQINEAMRRVTVLNGFSHIELAKYPSNSFDCVYIDPMFDEQIIESEGIKGLRNFAIYYDIDKCMIEEALRVAKDRVVLKDHFRSTRFAQFGFDVQKRKSAKFHYGILEKK